MSPSATESMCYAYYVQHCFLHSSGMIRQEAGSNGTAIEGLYVCKKLAIKTIFLYAEVLKAHVGTT